MFHDHPVAAHWSHVVATGWAVTGPALFLLLLAAGWWMARRRRAGVMAAAIWAPVGALAALLIDQPIERTPQVQAPFLHGLVSGAAMPAPSDHATLAAATAAGLFCVHRGLGALASGAAAVMALSFILAGAAPQDLAGGAVVGATVTLIGFVLLEGPLARMVARSRRTRLRSLTGAGKAS